MTTTKDDKRYHEAMLAANRRYHQLHSQRRRYSYKMVSQDGTVPDEDGDIYAGSLIQAHDYATEIARSKRMVLVKLEADE